MIKNLKTIIIVLIASAVLFALYRLTCIRIVNYEIAGVKIPSEYNIITGKIKPIINYKGNKALPALERFNANKIGLTDDQVASAQLRWAVFEQWANSRPEYKDWGRNAEVFKEALEAFRKEIETYKLKARIIR